ncbi:hypothetical protein OQJ15_02325 [Fluoribacter dumoffii]|uniref:Transmembrane protein n=1 Tax=Fluoribacter dumoffii TaxID=463 RepID=A0A377G801_9GAMM|nr:hypothetical protein [Fluoribacter dumoffii]KTC89840.1 hypothetical protein Ldum_0908 [Fluoribacter dumoffii NY 23]MCW8385135.1 hypothetical protein [Fluoribacter dumoffii]MCW8496567.1 hypothetical protein [Fluoribacter dumoffii]STO20955.1 Uncharacterised protein [Fluoribacter dumoffii]
MDNQKCFKTTLTSVHWPAIIAGAFVGVGLGFLLNIFSMAIGLSAYTSSADNALTVSIGGVLGLLIGVIASMGVAGFVAGYLGRFYHCYCHGGVLYGFITWSLALMLSALLIMPLTHYVSFYQENLDPNLAPTQISTADVNVSVTSQQNPTPQKMLNANPKHLMWSGWILFILFFLGGVSSCIGACYGMRCAKEENKLSL